jgi:hypothetical protein
LITCHAAGTQVTERGLSIRNSNKVKLISKGRMYELLARHVGLFDGPVDDRPAVPAFIFTDCSGITVQ